MVTKKTKTEEKVVKEEKASKYFYAVGRRKTAVAKIKLFPSKSAHNSLTINDRKFEEYFQLSRSRDLIKAPLESAGTDVKFEVIASVKGGGISAQADAIKLGIARALVILNEDYKKVLKSEGFLTRDSRVVERKKPGLKKARRAPQWAKR